MKKVFYLLKMNYKESYIQLNEYISALFINGIHASWHTGTKRETVEEKEGLIMSISEEDTTKYNCLLNTLNIEYEILSESQIPTNKQLSEGSFNDDLIDCFKEFQIPKISDYNDSTQILTEELIKRKDNIKLYTKPDENCGHHIPHIHVWYNDETNYCSISLIDFAVLAPSNYRNSRAKKCIDLLKSCITEAREAWNRTSGTIKFRVIDGRITDEIYDSSKE